MGTHPIFESDFVCLTDKNRARWSTFPNIKRAKILFSPRVNVVTTESNLVMVVKLNPSFIKRLKPPKRLYSDWNAQSPKRRSCWLLNDANISNLAETKSERDK